MTEKETTNTCYFCGLPLEEKYTVYKGIKVHPTCFCVINGKIVHSQLAEELKLLSEALNEKKSTTPDELFEILWSTRGYAKKSTCTMRVRTLMRRMVDFGIVEEGKEERMVVRKVKVWKKL